VALALETSGEDRFRRVAQRWRVTAGEALADDTDGPGGAGLVAVGGFAFAPAGGASPAWGGFAPASLIVPEVSLARRGGASWLTVNVTVAPDDTADDAAERVQRRLGELRQDPLPLLDPAPVGVYEVVSPMPPAHYEEAVARAVQRIVNDEFEKVVLAREVEVHAPVQHDPAAVLGLLREAFPTSYTYAVGRGDATFIGATPELLIRREGQRASTVALAGSTRRSADPAVDDHLGEQLLRSDKDREENAIVARRIAQTLRPFSVWVTAAPEPVVIKVANIQHLAAPIRAQLTSSIDAVELAGRLHPTPAVGAEPAAALEVIPALEGFDRGWYAGPVGWTDASGDGEFCVALRCALLRGPVARCYAGCGIVRDSDPAAELAETEVKLQVMLPALAS
jgi:isochorismate synthase